MFCARCGQPLPGGAAFCPSCGTPVTQRGDRAPLGTGATPADPVGAPADPPPLTPAAAGAGVVAEGFPGQTPVEGVLANERYGGFWRRVLAFIVDGLILGAVMLPFGISFGMAHLAAILNSEEVNGETILSMIAASLLAWFVRVIASWLYGAGFESSRFQATPGKMMVGVKVTDLNGKRITFARATGRQFGKWLSGLTLGIGYLLVAFSDRKQGLHDLIASTLVREGRTQEIGRV
jgi:uncharacterized RDD family membrane protein YckC